MGFKWVFEYCIIFYKFNQSWGQCKNYCVLFANVFEWGCESVN